MKKKVAELQEEVEQFKRDKMAELMKSQQPLMEKKLKDDLERSTTNLALLASQKKKLEAEIDEYQKQISKNGGAGGANWDFPLLEVDERTKMITSMIDKANLLRLEVNAPPRVADLQRAAVPMKRDLKKQLLGTIMAGLMGFGLVSFGVIVTESRVRRAMTLADVQKNVICPIAGVLPTRSGKKGTADGIGETMEKARINLLQQFARPGSKVIAVTSSLTEEGKAYLAWQLAESFSQAGSRTLLVDFDLRTPSLHREMQVDNERGVCDILLGKAELADFLRPALVSPYGGELEDGSASAAVPDDGPMAEPVDEGSVEASQDLQLIAIANPARYGNALTFLPAGKWTPEVRAGLNPERLEGILQSLRFQFDVVILNTHPLLEVAETFVLCRNSDAVLLSVERHESRVPLVARSHEKLASAGTEVLGIVYQGASSEECLN
jgi:Mrp family chromosome partitioning ATPase